MSRRKFVYNPIADKKWNSNNREKRNYLTYRGISRGFIKKHATIDDLLELKQLIHDKLEKN